MSSLSSFKQTLAAVMSAGVVLSSFGIAISPAQAAPAFVPDTLPSGRLGVFYEQSVRLDSSEARVWSLNSGTLPPGFVLNPTSGGTVALVKGTPSAAGSYTFTLESRLPYTLTPGLTHEYTVVIRPMEITQTTLPNAQVGAAYSQTLSVAGGTGPYEWSITSGQLPVGLTLNAGTGVISGTPAYDLTYVFTVKAKDQNGVITTKPLSIAVEPGGSTLPLVVYNASTLTNGRVGTAYSLDLLAGGGSTPYRWSLLSGSTLPPGLTLTTSADSIGQLRGTPTTAGNYSFSVKLLDAHDASITKTFNVSISPSLSTITPGTIIDPTIVTPLGLAITTSAVPGATVGMDYSTSLSATGGTAPYRWNFASGTLPPGLTLNSNGTITGRPTVSGSYTAYLEVFDARGTFVGRNFTFSIAAATPSTPGSSSDLTVRLNNLSRMGISVHALVKLPDDGNRFTQADSAVYYIGADGRRHAFPNDRAYFSWYSNFDGVRVISQSDLASIPLGANVTYKPGVKMVKFATDPKVYAVSSNRVLRWVKTEAAAQALYGSTWNRQIDDIADTFYIDYSFGTDINTASDFNRSALQTAARYVSDVLPL